MRIFILFFLVLISSAHGKNKKQICPDMPHLEMKGNIFKKIQAYDRFLLNLKTGEHIPALNEYKKDFGLPLYVSFPEDPPKEYPNYVATDDMGYPSAYVFFKKMVFQHKSDPGFDEIYEAKSKDSTKVVNKWNIPYNDPRIVGIEGSELIVAHTFSTFCAKKPKKFEVRLFIQPDGEYRVVGSKKIKSTLKHIKEDNCAAVQIIKNSDYTLCKEAIDQKTKKKRVLVYEGPMT
ncbi:MAG: hypothetical protein M9962_08720 [Oligoflexia bacterium]|nr:hypothetical protein [Oligoflexia bacterium]